MDNLLLAQEISFKHSHRSGLTSRCTLKMDLIQAFDSVNWCFLLNILLALGFPGKFVNLVKSCITTTRLSLGDRGFSGRFSWQKGFEAR